MTIVADEARRQDAAINAQYDSIPADALKPEAEIIPEEPIPESPEEPETPITLASLRADIPLMYTSSDIYNKEKTKDKLELLFAYNTLNGVKKLDYAPKMKPLNKKGQQVSKFYPLEEKILAACRDAAPALIADLQEREQKERELAAKKEPAQFFMSQEENDKLAGRVKIAGNIYKSGNFIKFCKNRFQKVWYHDEHVLEAVMYQAAVSRIKNADIGIHLHIAGDTQIGKSDSVKAALPFIHPSDWLDIQFTKTWIYYDNTELHERTILFSDDTSFTEEEAQLFRTILTSWKKGCRRGTVKNQEAMTLTIPPRISLILTSIESVCKEGDDGQDESRYLTVNVTRSEEDNVKIREFFQLPHPDISSAFEIIHTIWNTMGTSIEVKQHRIIEKDVPFRELKRFLDLMKAHALLMGRTETNDSDVDAIEKFLTYSNPMIDSTTPGLTKSEKLVDACLSYDVFKSIAQLEYEASLKYHQVARAIRGPKGSFDSPTGGLLKKVILVHTIDRNETQNTIHMFKKMHGCISTQTTI